MRTTPAPKRGLVSDEPTGRLCFGKVGPSDRLLSGSVRASFSVPSELRFNSPSRGSRSPATASWSRSSSISWESRTRSTAPTASCGSGRRRQRRPQYRRKRGLAPRPDRRLAAAVLRPENRQRVRGKAQSRLIDCRSLSTAAVGGCGLYPATSGKVTLQVEQTASRAFVGGVSL